MATANESADSIDFEDGNITGWTGDTASFSSSSGVLVNTSAGSVKGVYLSETDAAHDIRFDYIRYTAAGLGQCQVRYTDSNNRLWIDIEPTQVLLKQRDGGVITTLDTFSTTVSQNTWYSVRAVADGGDVTVWWGERGGDFNEILSATGVTELTTSRAAFLRASANSEHGWDDVQLIAGTRSTVETFTYNDANEQITHTKNGVATDMTYDEWGRMVERDDGTHTATYAYRYGSKLYSVASNFPGEGGVTYETGGDEKRRSRIAGAEETWYNWNASWTVLSEEDNADGDSGSLSRSYIGRDQANSDGSDPATGVYRYYNLDNLYSVRELRNEDKTLYAEMEFDPYGGKYISLGSVGAVSHRYTGHDWDISASLYFAPFRYYSVSAARWMTADPLGMIDGPNQYSYVRGSPSMNVDPLGLACGPGNGFWERLVPEYCNPFKGKFSNACEKHDACYAGCCPHKEKTRKECDEEFLDDMKATCKGPLCKACARIFYRAVRIGGKGPYDSDRKCEQ